MEKFDPSNVSFEEVAPLNEARHDAFGAAMNDKIYVAGGIQIQNLYCLTHVRFTPLQPMSGI